MGSIAGCAILNCSIFTIFIVISIVITNCHPALFAAESIFYRTSIYCCPVDASRSKKILKFIKICQTTNKPLAGHPRGS